MFFFMFTSFLENLPQFCTVFFKYIYKKMHYKILFLWDFMRPKMCACDILEKYLNRPRLLYILLKFWTLLDFCETYWVKKVVW